MLTPAPRLLISAPSTHAGKTTMTCALLGALMRRGLRPAAFKCGPDFIDPMFHRRTLGIPTANLDLFMSDAAAVLAILGAGLQGRDLAVIEGAMGFYDGVLGTDAIASAYHVARASGTPVILVLDARESSLTHAAVVHGLQTFRPDSHIAGILLNRCSDGMFGHYRAMIERECSVPVLGRLPNDPTFEIKSRHLGLMCADEVSDIESRLAALADAGLELFDLDALVGIAANAGALPGAGEQSQSEMCDRVGVHVWKRADTSDASTEVEGVADGGVSNCYVPTDTPTIAVARDEAFCFYYEENLRMLEGLGARLSYFSPLHGHDIPPDACGVYLGGGYPELHAQELQSNVAMRTALRRAHARQMPLLAECGGYLYLHEGLVDESNMTWEMVGIVPGLARRAPKRPHFGYEELTAHADSMLLEAGECVRAHEFHYYVSDQESDPGFVGAFVARKPHTAPERSWQSGVADAHLTACFPHLYFPGSPRLAERFVSIAREFSEAREASERGADTTMGNRLS